MVASRTWREIVYGTIVFETIVYISHILYTTLSYQIKNGRTSGFLGAEICARDVGLSHLGIALEVTWNLS